MPSIPISVRLFCSIVTGTNHWPLAFLARRLSELDSGDEVTDPDRAYLCGLLLDLGQLLLAHEFPHVYSQVLSEVERRPELDSAQLERQSLGITAQDAGVWLADRWHLPAEVVAVLAGLFWC